jgi:hypothetical protein
MKITKITKQFSQRISDGYRALTLSGLAFLSAAFAPLASAALPTADTVADGASTDSPIQASRDLVTIGVTILATLFAAALVIGAGWQIFNAYREAVRKGDWGPMATTSIVGVVMIAGGVVLAVLAVEYGTFA